MKESNTGLENTRLSHNTELEHHDDDRPGSSNTLHDERYKYERYKYERNRTISLSIKEARLPTRPLQLSGLVTSLRIESSHDVADQSGDRVSDTSQHGARPNQLLFTIEAVILRSTFIPHYEIT